MYFTIEVAQHRVESKEAKFSLLPRESGFGT